MAQSCFIHRHIDPANLSAFEYIGIFDEIFRTGVNGGHQNDDLADHIQPMGNAEQDQADTHHGGGGFDLA